MRADVLSYLRGAMQASESDYDYDGAFSYAGEYHSFTVGLAGGIVAAITGETWILAALAGAALGEEIASGTVAIGEFRREPWYGLGGVVIGLGIGTALSPLFS